LKVIVRQLLHNRPTIAISYVFGCGGKSEGAVCDPIDDVELYLRIAEENNLQIRYVIDTHLHADHLSGGRTLAERTGAEYVLHESASTGFPFHGAKDGEILSLGNVSVQVLHTPGHTPEHISLLVTDRTRATEPWFVLTGHTVMVGDIGRTELASEPEIGARALFKSIQRIKQLPDYLEVLPGAYAGSVCGRALSGNPASTIGFERRFNRAFQIDNSEEFVRHMLESIPPAPADAGQIRAANSGYMEPKSTSLAK
jgi:glyoxylase-like metal-dependent hydrolase (beta-lactamase superfamily II)